MHAADNRCGFTFRDGRRCRMLLTAAHESLCPHHARAALREAGQLSPPRSPLHALGILDSRRTVRRALKSVFREAAAGKIAPERGAVLTRLGQLVLASLPRRRHKPGRALPEPTIEYRKSFLVLMSSEF